MSPRPDVSAERRPQILQAAARVFLQKGFIAARMEDIAVCAGLSVGILYHYFPGKLDITLALMDLFLAPSLAATEELLTAPGTCRARLEGSFLRVLAKQSPDQLALYGEMYHLARYEPRVRVVLQEYNQHYQQLVAELLQQGVERGELRLGNLAHAAFLFQCLFDGMMQNLAYSTPGELQDILHEHFNMLFQGEP